MKRLALIAALFLVAPAIEAAPQRPLAGLQQGGGPVARVRAMRQRIKQKIQARRDARAAAQQAQQAQAVQQ
jgi:apolipoprotein N-acyltransferase